MVYRLISTNKKTQEQMIGMKSFDKDRLRTLAKKMAKEYDCEIVEILETFK